MKTHLNIVCTLALLGGWWCAFPSHHKHTPRRTLYRMQKEGAWLYLFRHTNGKYRSFLVPLCKMWASFLIWQRYRRDKPLLQTECYRQRKNILTKIWMFVLLSQFKWVCHIIGIGAEVHIPELTQQPTIRHSIISSIW